MIFDFNFSVSVSSSPNSHKGELSTMDSWAKEKFFKLQEREGQEYQEKQQQAQERGQIMAEAPSLWNQLTREVAMNVAEFSDLRPAYISMVDQSQSKTEPWFAVSRTDTTEQVKVTFNAAAPRIHFAVQGTIRGTREQGSYSFKLSEGNVMLFNEHNLRVTVPNAATMLLDKLIE
jgi:hypothetical protein